MIALEHTGREPREWNLPDYDFASHFADVGGHRMHYLDEGSGDPVVMVHGNPSWSFYYRRLVRELRPHFRCIVPDHIGCGASAKPNDADYDHHFAQRARDLETLLDTLGVDSKITLVVHDWGGMIGFLYATRHPERIARLVVLNTGAFHLPSTKSFPAALTLSRSPLGPFLIRGLNLFALGTTYIGCHRRRMSDAVRRGYLAPYDSWDHRRAVLRFVEDIPLAAGDRGYDLITETEGKLESLRHLPVQIFWGMKDFVFDRHFLARWEELFPDAEIHRFEDAGHYVLEDCFEEIRPHVRRFLDLEPAP